LGQEKGENRKREMGNGKRATKKKGEKGDGQVYCHPDVSFLND
jgi:hypothetical protein